MTLAWLLTNIVTALQAYLLGGINGSIITSKYIYRRDIREQGSGNPGLTNFLRVFGKKGVLLVIAIDVIKTVAPVLIGGAIFARCGLNAMTGRIFAGFCAMLGNAFPLYYGFKGGKAVMAIGVMLFAIDWRVTLLGWGVFAIVLACSRYVSLGAITGVWGFPIALAVFGVGTTRDLITAVLCATLLVIRHRENIKRLRRGEESKLSLRK